MLSLGVIERRGNRTCVSEHLPEVSVERGDNRKTFVRELFETRRVLEAPIFALAAERADDADRDAVETQLLESVARLRVSATLSTRDDAVAVRVLYEDIEQPVYVPLESR